MRKRIAAVTALGIGAGSLYLLKRKRRAQRRSNRSDTQARQDAPNDSQAIDDPGTDQAEAANLLRDIRDAAFDASDEKLALALGRPTEEIQTWTTGSGVIDGDLIMKARGLAIQRGVEIE